MATEQLTTGKEIIDATQNAVIEAADSVTNIIEKTAGQIDGHHEAFYMEAHFWVAVAFVLTVGLLAKPVSKLIGSMLNKRIDAIAKRIHDAAALKDDAQKLLAAYEQKFLSADDEAKAILDKSKKEIEYIKKENLAKLENEMKLKEKEAEDRINSSKEKASKEISDLTSEFTIQTVKTAIINKLDSKTQDNLIDKSIELLTKLK